MPRSTPLRRRRFSIGSIGSILLLAGASCRTVVPQMGPDPRGAQATIDGFFGGVAVRFDRVFRDDRVKTARRLIAKNTLVPSRVYNDTLAWVSRLSTPVRATGWRGTSEAQGYHFSLDTSRTALAHPGDSRQVRHLTKTGEDSYEWRHDADFGVGDAMPAALAAIPGAWFASGERTDSARTRAEIRATFPKGSHAFAQVVSLTSVNATRDASGAWTQLYTMTLQSERARTLYPAFAKWLKDYLGPARLRVRLRDSTRTWFDATMRDGSLTIRFRSRDGKLLPLEGGTAQLPDTVTFEMDASAKFSLFRVGFNKLVGRATAIRTATERGWLIRFTTEPDWQLPLLTEQMLHTPLRYPFQNAGTSYRVTAQRSPGASQTVLARQTVIPVQESTILRFVTKLASGGVGDYVDKADRDMNLWFTTVFAALRDDARAVLEAETRTPSR